MTGYTKSKIQSIFSDSIPVLTDVTLLSSPSYSQVKVPARHLNEGNMNFIALNLLVNI